MKRSYSNCLECLPSPEYSEPEYKQVFTSPKKSRVVEISHEFIEAIDNSFLGFINKDGSVSQKKYKVCEENPTNLILVFFGVLSDFLEPINESYENFQKIFNAEVIGVSSNLSSNSFAFPLINGTKISKKFNVLDPMGGGVYPRDVIIIFDKEGKKRVEIPIRFGTRCLLDKPITEVLMDCLEELESECMTL